MARLNPLLGDEAQKLLVERRRIGIQGLVGRVVEAEHLSVMWQATHFDPLPLDPCSSSGLTQETETAPLSAKL